MSDVDAPWQDAVDVREMSEADFETRVNALRYYDSTGEHRSLAEELGEEYLLDSSAVTDRAVRLYIAHLIDTGAVSDLRAKHDVHSLIPPAGWVTENCEAPPSISVSERRVDEDTYSFTTTTTVHDMMGDVVEETDIESLSALTKQSLDFLAAGCPEDFEP